MTAKTKASVLFDFFYINKNPIAEQLTDTNDPNATENAKYYAEAVTEEVIQELEELQQNLSHNKYSSEVIGSVIKYWKDVNSEIKIINP